MVQTLAGRDPGGSRPWRAQTMAGPDHGGSRPWSRPGSRPWSRPWRVQTMVVQTMAQTMVQTRLILSQEPGFCSGNSRGVEFKDLRGAMVPDPEGLRGPHLSCSLIGPSRCSVVSGE
ncbi:uncharacterized protein V6R79_023477 [Siganus canaliculatus]